MSTPPPGSSSLPHRRLRLAGRLAVAATTCSGVTAFVIWQRQQLDDLPELLASAGWAWIVAAIVLQGGSVAALARLQRKLLSADGRSRMLRPILATAYAANAISQSLPIVGSAASAVYAFRRFERVGADKVLAAWVIAVSGIYSTVAFVALSAIGAVMSSAIGVAIAGAMTLLTGPIAAVAVLSGLRSTRVQPALLLALSQALAISQRIIRRPVGDPSSTAANLIDNLTSHRLSLRDSIAAGSDALSNWILDMACFVCTLAAVNAPIPWSSLILAWAAGAGASTVGLTPGGLGIVEATLSIALATAGVPTGLAVSATLLYRFIKLWLVVAAGYVTLLVIRTRSAKSPDTEGKAN